MKILYIHFDLKSTRDKLTVRGLRECGVEVAEIADNSSRLKKYWRIARLYRMNRERVDAVIVGYAGAVLVLFMRFFTRLPLVYNSMATFYDGMVVSRFNGAFLSLRSAWYVLLDTLAFRAADHTFLESKLQKEMVMRVYKIAPGKLSVQYMGADDHEFHPDKTVNKLPRFTVVFRGMFLPEGGADIAVRAAKELEQENVGVRIIGRGFLLPEIERLARELMPSNLELITKKLPLDELRRSMLECHISLGQLARHPRLSRTIPHKAYESMSMGLPYLTGANEGVLELLTDGETCFAVPPGDPKALARKILELRDRPHELARVAENARNLYLFKFTPAVLAANMLSAIKGL